MRIFITGATGLIGSALCQQLVSLGHTVVALTRDAAKAKAHFGELNIDFCTDLTALCTLDDIDAVINLAGEPIFDKRWHKTQKKRLIESRVTLTQTLVGKINASQTPPQVLISGSAIGFYGNVTQSAVDESAPAGEGFAAELCQRWEQAALNANTRVCLLRTSNVLATHAGALSKMLLVYRLGLGGPLGSGEQNWAWIHLADMVNAILFLLTTPSCQGPFNCCAPHFIPQAQFSHTLANVLHRPHFAFVPAFALKLMLGERAQLLLDNQPIMPNALTQAGFRFTHPTLDGALRNLLT
ncbi:TIGR01777 family protein [Pasteurellaceae bacterium HPA106]|uniref:TIGR01777 family oxidoreductase n=1 Tax=Spirabiliibacterium pneumoniae TaxID=221400 RepID=UPI001AADD261|nr:TIGR01777 family oxidoreductase [Spirabiliibacterium pneumoniae]MBE2896630.1 TIGR01777 family protein [Spirabiliibacterium pneumoniae]